MAEQLVPTHGYESKMIEISESGDEDVVKNTRSQWIFIFGIPNPAVRYVSFSGSKAIFERCTLNSPVRDFDVECKRCRFLEPGVRREKYLTFAVFLARLRKHIAAGSRQ